MGNLREASFHQFCTSHQITQPFCRTRETANSAQQGDIMLYTGHAALGLKPKGKSFIGHIGRPGIRQSSHNSTNTDTQHRHQQHTTQTHSIFSMQVGAVQRGKAG